MLQKVGRIAQEQRASKVGVSGAGIASAPDTPAERPDILFISHCVPNPPEKGEKIRSFHVIHSLVKRYRVHLVCFAHNDLEVAAANDLRSICSSVYVEKLRGLSSLARGATRLMLGGCLNTAYYSSRRMRRHIETLVRQTNPQAAYIFSAVMMQYSLPHIPALLDMQDVDSEKWFGYAETRFPGILYALEARRLRKFEIDCARDARKTMMTTRNEENLLCSIAPNARTGFMENGVDTDYFTGALGALPPQFQNRRFIAFVGTMNYYPNIEGACWFATRILPELRRRDPGIEFLIIGQRPVKAVLKLAEIDGVTVTGGVPDIRPFLAAAKALVVPLRIARGIQNKVLEALAMGRHVYVSDDVARTFGGVLPHGVVACASESEFIDKLDAACKNPPQLDPEVRRDACTRFSWANNLQTMNKELEALIPCGAGVKRSARGVS